MLDFSSDEEYYNKDITKVLRPNILANDFNICPWE